MLISWIDFSIADYIKPFSLSLEQNDFLFLAGETCSSKLFLALAGFLPEECNFTDALRIEGQKMRSNETFKSVLLPKNAVESLPPHRTIGQFALDLSPDFTKKKLVNHAAAHGIDKQTLYSRPAKISEPILQKISLWLCSLNPSAMVFIEEPKNGFFEEIRPFDFLQSLLKKGITKSIVYLTDKKEVIFQKAKIMQFCRARIAVFCADRLVEEGEAVKILENPIHPYTQDWLKYGSTLQLKNGALWHYCKQSCSEQHNCSAKQSLSYISWDCGPAGLHKVICRGFI